MNTYISMGFEFAAISLQSCFEGGVMVPESMYLYRSWGDLVSVEGALGVQIVKLRTFSNLLWKFCVWL